MPPTQPHEDEITRLNRIARLERFQQRQSSTGIVGSAEWLNEEIEKVTQVLLSECELVARGTGFKRPDVARAVARRVLGAR